jgi:protein SCO1/2
MKSSNYCGAASREVGVSRRGFLRTALQSCLIAPPLLALPGLEGKLATQGRFHEQGSVKPPAPVPDVEVVRNDGASTKLTQLLEGHATAVQLMFTSCTSTCPMEAAIFQRVQNKIPDMAGRKIQLLSLSVAPEVDTPQALTQWLRRFHAGPCWISAASGVATAALIREFFGDSRDAGDHSNQVSLVDRKGRMVWRTYELPEPEEIISVLEKI